MVVSAAAAQRHQAQRLNQLQDEEESSLLHGNSNSKYNPPTPTPSPSSSLSNDFTICNTAWNRLSCPTRSMLLAVTGVLLIFATYEFAVDEGIREQVRDNGMNGVLQPWKIFNGAGDDDDKVDNEVPNNINMGQDITIDKNYARPLDNDIGEEDGGGDATQQQHQEQPVFTNEILSNTRQKAQELIDTLHEYYGGQEKANSMLVHSWQAQWMLSSEFTLIDSREEDQNDDDDDDDSFDDDAADDSDSGKPRRLKRKLNYIAEDDEDDNKELTRKEKNQLKKKKKGAKEGKIIVNPDIMSPEELVQHHHHRRQRTTKLVETMARAILNPHQDTFKIGTIGSSVAAGHDNCDYDTYENQLQRTITPIFAAANMNAIVQNAGEGGGCGDNHQNQVYCITHNVSPDVDIIHYSWTYFEKETPEIQREQLIRWASTMERRPMVHHLVARGKKNTCDGDTQANVDLDKAYAMFGYNAFCIQTGLFFGGYDYDTEVEAGNNRFGWKHMGDGYHNTTRYGEELDDDDPRKASLGVVYRNWHPGPLGFQVASDAFAYVYIKGLMKALDIIEQDMNDGVNLLSRWFDTDDDDNDRRQLRASSRRRQLHEAPPVADMPEPLFCNPIYCSTPHPPNCLNYELPTFGNPGIQVKSQSDWVISHEDNKWNYEVGKVDIAWIKPLHDPEWEAKCAHADACGGVSAENSTQGVLTYELPSSKMTAGLVFLCGCCGKKVGSTMFIENPYVTFKLNGRTLDKSTMDVFPNQKCVRLLKWFGDGEYKKEDTMFLTVELADRDDPATLDDDDEEVKPPTVKISHVVAL